MAYRNSLKKCLQMMVWQMRQGNHQKLAIIRHKKAKYYTLVPMEELDKQLGDGNWIPADIVCSVTNTELGSFITNIQIGMDLEECPRD